MRRAEGKAHTPRYVQCRSSEEEKVVAPNSEAEASEEEATKAEAKAGSAMARVVA